MLYGLYGLYIGLVRGHILYILTVPILLSGNELKYCVLTTTTSFDLPIFSKKLEPNTVMAKLYSRLSASTKRVCIKYRSSKAAIIKRKTNRKNSEETQKDSVS